MWNFPQRMAHMLWRIHTAWDRDRDRDRELSGPVKMGANIVQKCSHWSETGKDIGLIICYCVVPVLVQFPVPVLVQFPVPVPVPFPYSVNKYGKVGTMKIYFWIIICTNFYFWQTLHLDVSLSKSRSFWFDKRKNANIVFLWKTRMWRQGDRSIPFEFNGLWIYVLVNVIVQFLSQVILVFPH